MPAHGGRSHRGLPHEVATEVAMFTRAGVDAHHALRLRAGAVAAAQAAHRGHQVQRAALRHGDVGRDRGRGRAGISRRHLGQDAGRRDDHAHDAQAARRSTRSSRPTCTPTSCPTSRRRWRARSASRRPPTSTPSARRPRCSSRSTARPSTSPARASPTRSARSGPRVMMLEHLGEKAAAVRLMRAVERVTADTDAAHARSRRQGHDPAGHRRGDRGAARRQSLSAVAAPNWRSRPTVPRSHARPLVTARPSMDRESRRCTVSPRCLQLCS